MRSAYGACIVWRLQLLVRISRRKHICLRLGAAPQAQRTHERRSIDFVHDQLIDGRPFRMLTLIDQFSCLSSLVEPRIPFPVVMSLKHWIV